MASSSKWKGDDDDGARKYKTSWEKQYTWLTEDGQGNSYSAAMVNGAKRCHSFLIEAISQVENRLPPARYIFSSLFVLSRQPSYHS
ncbi:hypothetical protein RRG08_046105 [Elysia crispata]|uniref:Uncharacterized protein n=1 Tax=Elysia crispata TaxID=231223 RepID=A0AAE0Y5D8_9GAST|nr:hypothetical protein RRG08_046105 [Elysia crispata]